MAKRDKTFLVEKLCWGVFWDEFTNEEKWAVHSLQSSDYLYHTRFIQQESAPDGRTIYKVRDETELRLKLGVFNA